MEASRERSFVHRFPFYYGWIIMAAGTIGLIMTQPGQSPVLSIFTDAFIEDLRISRSLTSTLFTVGTVIGGLSLPFWGRRIDRHGPRAMVTAITALLGASCLYMGVVQNALMLGLGYVLLRMLGASALMLVSRNVINQWWVERRGTMMGVSGLVFSLVGMGIFTNFVHALLQRFGWRTSYAILGAMELLVMLPLGMLLFRDRPEDHGLHPDGQLDPPEALGDEGSVDASWTRAEAVRTPAFWTAAAGLAASAMLGTGLYFHVVSIFASQGLSADLAAVTYLPISLTSAGVRLASGYLADRVPVRFVLAAGLVALSGALGLAQVIGGLAAAVIYGVAMGLSSGMMGTVASVIWADYYGRRHLGSISGLATTVSRVSSALGPLPLAVAYDLSGSYDGALTIEMMIPLALAAITVFVRRPQKTS